MSLELQTTPKFGLGLTLLLILGTIQFQPCMGQEQYVQLFNADSCAGPIVRSYTDDSFGVDRTGISSALVFGMWQIGICGPGTQWYNCWEGVYTTYVANDPSCVQLVPLAGWPMHLKRLGSQNMRAAELFLYPMPGHNATTNPEIVYQHGRNSHMINVGSYFFTGNHRWQLFDGPDYTRNFTCLHPLTEVSQQGFGFTQHHNVSYTVRSVRYGCNSAYSASGSTLLLSLGIFMFIKFN